MKKVYRLLHIFTQTVRHPQTVQEVIAENLVDNMPMEQIDEAIELIDYPVTSFTNEMIIEIAMSDEEISPDAMDIANAIVTEIDLSESDYDYKLLEAIAYIEEYHSLSP